MGELLDPIAKMEYQFFLSNPDGFCDSGHTHVALGPIGKNPVKEEQILEMLTKSADVSIGVIDELISRTVKSTN
jgi:hypothetical protein